MTASWMARSRALTSREGLVGEVMGLKIAPDRLDFIEFGGVFRQPLDGEPVCAGGQGGERPFAGVDRTIVLDQHDRLGLSPGLRHRLTVSSRRPSASAILELVQPASEKHGGAGSALAVIHVKSARANRPARCSSLAVTGDFPAMPFGAGSEPQKTYPLVSQTESA